MSSHDNYKVLISDKLGQDGIDVFEAATDIDVDVRTGLSTEELISVIPDYDALVIRSGTTVTAEILQAGKNLKVVGRAGVGVDNVDVDAATRRGIIVMNTPGANTIATAEHAFALMAAASRNIAQAHASLVAGRWDRSAYTGWELKGKTLGIIGFGRIGRALAVRAQAFEMSIMAYDPFVSERVGREAKVELADLGEVLAASDYVSLHTSLSDQTKNLINAETLAAMKPTAFVINAARGGLVDAKALAAALDAGDLRGAAVDVYDSEPPGDDNPLIGHPRVTHTPHLGASTDEAQRSVAIEVAEQVIDALRDTRITNSVNLAYPPSMDHGRVNQFINLATKIGRLQAAMADSAIESVELELYADDAEDLMRPVASGLLQGLLEAVMPDAVNHVNAPLVAKDRGIKVSRSVGLGTADYRNEVICRVHWAGGGTRTVGGVLFGDDRPRIVQISNYHLEADPTGVVLLMLNNDVPGVVGAVGGVLGEHDINVGEWRLGRNADRTEALSFINLDSDPDPAVLDALRSLEAVQKAVLTTL